MPEISNCLKTDIPASFRAMTWQRCSFVGIFHTQQQMFHSLSCPICIRMPEIRQLSTNWHPCFFPGHDKTENHLCVCVFPHLATTTQSWPVFYLPYYVDQQTSWWTVLSPSWFLLDCYKDKTKMLYWQFSVSEINFNNSPITHALCCLNWKSLNNM